MADISATTQSLVDTSEVFFKIKLLFFENASVLKIFWYAMKINNLQGDLSDILAKKTSLVDTRYDAQVHEWRADDMRYDQCFCFQN